MEKSPVTFDLTTGFSFLLALYLIVKKKENLTLHQGHLGPYSTHPINNIIILHIPNSLTDSIFPPLSVTFGMTNSTMYYYTKVMRGEQL